MANAVQLVVTHGISDLQLLVRDEDGRLLRAVPDKTIVRRFHEWLLASGERADVVDLPEGLTARETEVTFTDWRDERFVLRLGDGCRTAKPEYHRDGRLQIVLPKIATALSCYLAEQAEPQCQDPAGRSPLASAMQKAGIRPSRLIGALVLSTDRAEGAQEPVASFTFLKRWLLTCGVPASGVHEEIFLRSGERLESPDSPVAPAIARRIEMAMHAFYRHDQRPVLLVASMGGLPPVKPLLAEIAVLLAGDDAQSLFRNENGDGGLLSSNATDSIRVRRQCLQQVRRGALLDAWTLARPMEQGQRARVWVEPLSQAARLLNGNPVGERVELPALQAILGHAEKAACLLAAIRVETALLNERWLEAINGSFTFMEAAFFDAINAWAKDALVEYQPRKRYMRFREQPPKFLVDSGAIGDYWEKGAKPFSYYSNVVGDRALLAWERHLNVKPLQQMREAFFNTPQVTKGSPFRLADFRNFNTHGILTQAEIDQAVARFMAADLWSQGLNTSSSRPGPGKCFLGRARVSRVIQHFTGAETQPLQLYQDLLHQLEARLVNPA